MDGYGKPAARLGGEPNPYRAGFLQLIAVSETDAQAEADYAEAATYFYERCLHVYRGFADGPGYRPARSLQAGLTGTLLGQRSGRAIFEAGGGWKGYIEEGNILAGSPRAGPPPLRE